MSESILENIAIDNISPDPQQPRKSLVGIDELAASIKEKGLIQPPVIRPDPNDNTYSRYIIIAGERRWTACKKIGLDSIDCLIKEVSTPEEILTIQITENIQKEDMNVLDTANAIARLRLMLGSSKDVAESLGKSPSYVSRFNVILSGGELTQEIAANVSDVSALASFAKLEKDSPRKASALFSRLESENFADLRDSVNRALKGKRAVKKKTESSTTKNTKFNAQELSIVDQGSKQYIQIITTESETITLVIPSDLGKLTLSL